MINKATILAANKAYSSLQTIFRAEQIHQNNKIRLYKTLNQSCVMEVQPGP